MEQIYKSFELLIFVQKFLRKVYLFQSTLNQIKNVRMEKLRLHHLNCLHQ
jgi:hypothetical protein